MKSSILKSILSMVSFTNRLILLNVVLFIIFWITLFIKPEFVNYLSIMPNNFFSGAFWTLITSMFMHQGVFHLFVNMLSLFFLGNLSEQIIGRKRFLILYLSAGILGGLFFVFGAWFGNAVGLEKVFGGMGDYAVGASGAIFGLLGLLAVLIPRYKVYLIIGPILVILLQVVSTPFLPVSGIFDFAFFGLMLISIFAMFSANPKFRRFAVPAELPMWAAPFVAIIPLVAVSFFVALPIGNTAHLGGLVAGLIFGAVLVAKYPKKVSFLRRAFSK